MNATPESPAPFHACSRCRKGDTTTAFVHVGSVEAHLEVHRRLGLSRGDALATVNKTLNAAVAELGLDASELQQKAAEGKRLEILYRLCPPCAEKTGFPIGPAEDPPAQRFDSDRFEDN